MTAKKKKISGAITLQQKLYFRVSQELHPNITLMQYVQDMEMSGIYKNWQ